MTRQYIVENPTPPSQIFLSSLRGKCGAPSLECGWCGRDHLCPDTHFYDEVHEPERHKQHCEELHTRNPDGVILHRQCDFVGGVFINDIVFVIDCPCNGLTRIENAWWLDKESIISYITYREEEERRLKEADKIVGRLKGIKDDKKETLYR